MVSFGPRENIISNFLWGSDSWDGKKIDKNLVKKEIDSYEASDLKDSRRMHFMLRDAIEAGNDEIVKYLLDRGACPIVIYNDLGDTIRGEYAITDVFTEDLSLTSKLNSELATLIFKRTLEIVEGAMGRLEEEQRSPEWSENNMAESAFGKLSSNLLERLGSIKEKIRARFKLS
ncbi:MAG: hypothetical protein LBU15_01440 [Rickettsiales bacterium]|jgi:hypothetical protein|nr:hypothetical protein [Rickettsiales bacterium]